MPFIFDFKRRLSIGKAVLFYLFWLVAFVILGGIIAGVVCGAVGGFLASEGNRPADPDYFFHLGFFIGALVALVSTTALALAILIVRGAWKQPLAVILALLAVLGSVVAGGLLGLAPLAVIMCLTPPNQPEPTPPNKPESEDGRVA